MLWAIDVGNTHTVVGVWREDHWHAVWRLETDRHKTEDELAILLKGLCDLESIPWTCTGAVIGSVVPGVTPIWKAFFGDRFGKSLKVLERGDQVGLTVKYDPPHGVGADRIANALGGIALFPAPLIVIDFGTATTFDVIDASGDYIGGAILPGVLVSMEALASRAAKLPPIALRRPEKAIGRNTVESLESGLLWGSAGAINEVGNRIREELGQEAKIIATGGLGPVFVDLCPDVESHHPNLTLDGLRIAFERLR